MSANKLLVIDDDKDIGDILVELGAQHGFETVHAEDFESARVKIDEWKPTAIITDLQMPRVDGITVLRFLARHETNARIGVISGLDEKVLEAAENVARERGLTVAGRLSKPFKIEAAADLLERLKGPQKISAKAFEDALAVGQIEVHFQPKCATSDGAVIGAEALLRWPHPRFGMIPAEQLVSYAEDHGMADALLDHVLLNSVKAIETWNRAGLRVPLAINMTPVNLQNLCLPDRMDVLCEIHQCDPRQITFELTEKTSMEAAADVLDVLARLRIKGFRLSIDDFGTGFSSLARLRQMPFSEIKIDRSFVGGMAQSKDCEVIVNTIASMARNMALTCVAEGVESAAVARKLRDWGCPVGQGYFFARAMPVDGFLQWAQPTHVSGELLKSVV